MKKTVIRQSLVMAVALFALTVIVPVTTFAQSTQAQEAQTRAQARRDATQQTAQVEQQTAPSGEQAAEEPRIRAQERRPQGQARLETAKLKACQNREKAITNIMVRMSERGTKQLAVFTKISDRAQVFYTEKGNTLQNYDTLVTDLNVKKEAAQTAVDVVKSTSTEFQCDGENPKAVAENFKANRQVMNAALKEYKTAVKDLIVGVKSVQSTVSQNETERSQE